MLSNHRYRPALAALALSLAACASGGGGGALPASVAARFEIDGVVDFAALSNVQQVLLEFVDGFGAGTPTGKFALLRWAVVHDDRYLYMAFEWDDDTHDNVFDITAGPLDFDGIKVLFDVDGDGVYEAGEDARNIIAASVSSQFIDQHADPGDETDLIGDGRGRLAWDPARLVYQAELLIPLADDANGDDGVLTAASRYELILMDHFEIGPLTGNAVGLHGLGGVGADATGWEDPGLTPMPPHAHVELPVGLTGLIAFLSSHENPMRDVYVFDPATRVTTRVTNDPTIHKDNISLSNDRTRVAYHGTPDPMDGDALEIYVVNVDGTGLAQLTNNAFADGHPGWSPDDSEIVYASQRSGFRVVVMDAVGNEVREIVPPFGTTDNDPDWLPDGRIVFKTSRWTAEPEVRIAVMDADGSNVQQLTFVDGVSDHDPVADGSFTIFERFPKDTDLYTDVETGFIGWPIVEAALDATGEVTLVDDGWLNFLPVYDPTGGWIVCLKQLGYNEAHLLDRSGKSYGRLIPAQTRIHYLDWK